MRVKVLCDDYKLNLRPHQIDGPSGPREYLDWNVAVRQWRREQHERVRNERGTTGYDVAALKWSQSSYVQPQVMANDRFLYDCHTNRYTVDRFLRDIHDRYGDIDSIVVWPPFPNLGCDSRNTEDFFRCLPGGPAGVRSMIEEFHERGIKVLLPMLPWDNGTRDPKVSWSYILPRLFKECNADGISSDVAFFTQDYWLNAIAIGHPLVLQSTADAEDSVNRSPISDENVIMRWNTMDMAKYDTKLRIPTVASRKYLESRHMTHSSDKWSRNKTDLIQHAFFNGIGVETWENIFGTWNQISPRDGEALRRTSKIMRCFGPTFFANPDWEPHTPCIQWKCVFGSRWVSSTTANQVLWTFVNRSPLPAVGHQIVVGYQIGWQFYDVWRGEEIFPTNIVDGLATLSFDIEPRGYGCIFATPDIAQLPDGVNDLLFFMRRRSKIPLYRYPISNSVLWQEIDEIQVSPVANETPLGMVRIDGDLYNFTVSGRGAHPPGLEYPGADIKYPWEYEASRVHATYQMKIRPFFMDAYPVTEEQFKEFLDATHYQPADSTNFLKHWIEGCYPVGSAKKPVVHVSLEDARAYAAWAGKRLPHEWEWQYVAQAGVEYRTYPWGDHWDDSKVPIPYSGRGRLYPDHAPADVDAYPQGRSLFGVYDLVGNVWQWTDVYLDEHTRAAIIRGGSYYKPQHSDRYFPQAYKNTEHGKYLLMAPSIDRSATIGFRCVKDTPASAAVFGNCPWYGQDY
ncbi:C-type lectin protein [Radiomyces spectabilis]|uniref:C-type lectin protein n=1 Tax=Radiomyces spectabilis TaxID=64574 RepID=UPI00221EFAF1|nr:C-type lectin protein [Radiomyces spectabilis]KAI8377656.1 C-type lectin protein [Radiomyces spectabilis]